MNNWFSFLIYRGMFFIRGLPISLSHSLYGVGSFFRGGY